MTEQRPSARQSILSAACQVGMTQGLAQIGTRLVAREAAVSPSLVSHYFGGSDALIHSVRQEVIKDHVSDLFRLLGIAQKQPSHLRTCAGFMGELIRFLSVDRRMRSLLLLEIYLSLLDEKFDFTCLDRFWSEFAASFALSPETTIGWRLLAESSLPLACLGDGGIQNSWLTAVFFRFDARINGFRLPNLPHLLKHDLASAAPAPHTSPPESDGNAMHPRARAIVDATIKLLGKGVPVTYRAIAVESAASLSSITHFFGNKASLMSEVYRALYSSVSVVEDFGTATMGSPFDEDGTPQTPPILFARLLIAASRDSEMSELAKHLLNSRGFSAIKVLKKHGAECADITDGIIWSIIHGAYNSFYLGREPSQRRQLYHTSIATVFNQLFGKYPG